MKEHEIKVTKQDDGSFAFEWEDDAPIIGVHVAQGNIDFQTSNGLKDNVKFKFVGDCDYFKHAFDLT